MNKPLPFVVRPQDRERALSVVGCGITVLASNQATGSYEVTLQAGAEGAGPPPHSHPWDEAFFVVRGPVNFLVAGEAVRAEAGTFIHIPAGTVHAFQFPSADCQMLELTGSGGGATKMFRAVDVEVPPGPPDVEALVALLARHQVTVHVPAEAAQPA
jgi:quercetin dioxygenase-like cupin family protein